MIVTALCFIIVGCIMHMRDHMSDNPFSFRIHSFVCLFICLDESAAVFNMCILNARILGFFRRFAFFPKEVYH